MTEVPEGGHPDDRWICVGCGGTHPWSTPREHIRTHKVGDVEMRQAFCPLCILALAVGETINVAIGGGHIARIDQADRDSITIVLDEPPGPETFAEGLQADEERPSMLAPGQAPYVDPTPS